MQLYFYLGAIICCSGGEKTIEWKREQGLTYDADTSVALRDSWTVVSCYMYKVFLNLNVNGKTVQDHFEPL